MRIYGERLSCRWYLFFCIVSVGCSSGASDTREELVVHVREDGPENVEEIITSLTCTKNELKIGINPSFRSRYLKADFFAFYDEDIDLEKMPYEIVTMPLICNIISLIWISGKTYSIDSMDENLYHSLKTIKKIFQLSYPRTVWEGHLIPKKLVKFSKQCPVKKAFIEKHTSPLLTTLQQIIRATEKVFHLSDCESARYEKEGSKGSKVFLEQSSCPKRALLFSGGLDSTSSLFFHNNEKLMLITAWGQYDNPLEKEHIWEKRKKKITQIARLYGHTNAFLKSNYAEFFNWKLLDTISPDIDNWRICTVEGIGWAGLVAPIFFAKGYSELYIASSTSWYYPYIDCINPYVDHSVRFGNYRLLHDQFDYTRLDKAIFIATLCKEKGLKKPFIKVCQYTRKVDDINCCECRKCLTTILSLFVVDKEYHKYGFPVSLQAAVHRSMRLLKKGVTYETVWNFMDIQNTLKDVIDHFEPSVVETLRPFLNMNLAKRHISDRRYIKKIDWRDFTKLVPTITIPFDLSTKKLAINTLLPIE
ncbi:hypothetical protein H0X06_04565 [Candidatus Dependentiae bacterium]|nr:hypothetical protein [Candidatus Dependentiae bacterium]